MTSPLHTALGDIVAFVSHAGTVAAVYIRPDGHLDYTPAAGIKVMRNPDIREGRKLSEDDVRAIRARCAAGERQKVIAIDYGVARETINSIWKGNTWGWVK